MQVLLLDAKNLGFRAALQRMGPHMAQSGEGDFLGALGHCCNLADQAGREALARIPNELAPNHKTSSHRLS
jgi:hypothetical protein